MRLHACLLLPQQRPGSGAWQAALVATARNALFVLLAHLHRVEAHVAAEVVVVDDALLAQGSIVRVATVRRTQGYRHWSATAHR